MVAGICLNGLDPGLNGIEDHHVATAKSAVHEVKLSNGHVEQKQLPDAVLSGEDEFVFLPEPHKKPPIAICGMAMRLPGGVESDADFWRLLLEKKDACGQVPADRYNIDAFQSNTNKSGTIQTARGYFLDYLDLAHFDASFFSMTRSELERLDPQHRLLLELTRECLENAGETGWRGKNIGCYIGSFGEDWLQIQTRDTMESTSSRITGYGDYLLANKVSYEYDFKGPR